MQQLKMSKARLTLNSVLIEITAAIGATITIAIGVPCIACHMLIERYKRRRDMSGIYQDIEIFLKQCGTNTR